MTPSRDLAEVLAPCKCPMCGAPTTVYRRPMFSGEEAMASGVPDDYVDHYRYDAPDLLSRAGGGEDSARLDWLETQREAYGFEHEHLGNRWVLDGPFNTARAAIDAMAKERGG